MAASKQASNSGLPSFRDDKERLAPAKFGSRDSDVYAFVFELAVAYPDLSITSHVVSRFVAIDILEHFEHVMKDARVFGGKGNATVWFSFWLHLTLEQFRLPQIITCRTTQE